VTERNPLESWLDEVARELGIDAAAVDVRGLLDLTRDVAHGVARPAAPLTTFLVGVAVGQRGGDLSAATQDAVATVQRLAQGRPSST
jgi:Domain of unknown function (DUF6457)